MNTTTILRSCARDLREVRAQLPDNLEPGVMAQFESVVGRLERCETIVNDQVALSELIEDGLRLVGRLCELSWVIAETVKHFRP
jgi:hypothetical protein